MSGLAILIKDRLFPFLCRAYVQRADARQKALGLQYTEAETHDLAEAIGVWVVNQGFVSPDELAAKQAEVDKLKADLKEACAIRQQTAASFNAAINFAIKQGLEAPNFLSAWREGDTSEWPEFKA